jgi:precorrin-6B methylase 2
MEETQMKNRKAQGLSMNVIIIVALALIVLVVVTMIFIGKSDDFKKENETTLATNNSLETNGAILNNGITLQEWREATHEIKKINNCGTVLFISKKEITCKQRYDCEEGNCRIREIKI